MLRLGLFTDLHYAHGVREGTRFCHLGIDRLRRAVETFATERVDAIIGLGDLVDSADTPEQEGAYLGEVVSILAASGIPYHLVPGNHCIWTLTKQEYCQITRQPRTWSSVHRQGWQLLFLDGCFRSDDVSYGRRSNDWKDAKVSDEQVAWLERELAAGQGSALVFIHQRLDVDPPYGVCNAPRIRALLDRSGRVRGVFQGHEHAGARTQISGIPYTTLPAMVEGSQMAPAAVQVIEADGAGVWRIQGS